MRKRRLPTAKGKGSSSGMGPDSVFVMRCPRRELRTLVNWNCGLERWSSIVLWRKAAWLGSKSPSVAWSQLHSSWNLVT